jgi:ferric-dicitrate binding protein FerR (iron transport regulator)
VVEILEGAVYAVSGGGRTLEVRTPLGPVHDIGTRFEVRRLDGLVRVRVREGRASLTRAGVRHEAAAGEELTAGAAEVPERRRVATAGPQWDWTLGLAPPFRLEGRSVADFLEWYSAETGRQVRFRDPALARQVGQGIALHGMVEALAPHEALDVVLPAAGLAYRLSDEALELEKGRGR